jgi:hypothetical protein
MPLVLTKSGQGFPWALGYSETVSELWATPRVPEGSSPNRRTGEETSRPRSAPRFRAGGSLSVIAVGPSITRGKHSNLAGCIVGSTTRMGWTCINFTSYIGGPRKFCKMPRVLGNMSVISAKKITRTVVAPRYLGLEVNIELAKQEQA